MSLQAVIPGLAPGLFALLPQILLLLFALVVLLLLGLARAEEWTGRNTGSLLRNLPLKTEKGVFWKGYS